MRLIYQFHLLQAIRIYFVSKEFIEVMTPPMVENPGIETHIHPFQVYSANESKKLPMYLHTSPEFHMKKLLADTAENLTKIFTLTYSFRDEPQSPEHRNQFIMLEWYRKEDRYEKIMDDCEELIISCHEYLKNKDAPVRGFDGNQFQRLTIQELFLEYCNFDILEYLEKDDLKNKIQQDFPSVPLPAVECSWDDYYFLLFLNIIEPKLKNIPFIMLTEFPAPLAALSTLKESDSRVCERFEIYMYGIEICNCFNELTNKDELVERFTQQNTDKKSLYQYDLPTPEEFYNTMNNYPKSSGIALGVERLLLALTKVENPFFT